MSPSLDASAAAFSIVLSPPFAHDRDRPFSEVGRRRNDGCSGGPSNGIKNGIPVGSSVPRNVPQAAKHGRAGCDHRSPVGSLVLATAYMEGYLEDHAEGTPREAREEAEETSRMSSPRQAEMLQIKALLRRNVIVSCGRT